MNDTNYSNFDLLIEMPVFTVRKILLMPHRRVAMVEPATAAVVLVGRVVVLVIIPA